LEEEAMKTKTKALLAGGLVAVTAAVGSGVAYAAAGRDGPIPTVTGLELDRAEQAALDHVGEGRVTDTETGDEESFYEVEVTRADGTEVDVQLDRSLRIVGQEADAPDGPHDDDGPSED
jgi:hypothetical protein